MFLIPDFNDFILTKLSYDNNCKTYFVLRIINQGIIIFFVSFLCYSSYSNCDGIDEIEHIYFVSCLILFILSIEILSLVKFY